MQGGALGDSHAVAERASKAGLLVEPMEKPTGGRFTSLDLKTGGAPVLGLERPADKCAAAGGSSCRSSGTLGAGGRPTDGPCNTWWDLGGRKLQEGGRHVAPSQSLLRGEAKSRRRRGRPIKVW